MRQILYSLIAGVCFVMTVSRAPAGEGDARALVNKSIEAVGGEKALARHAAVTFTDKGTYYGMGDGLPYAGKYAMQAPDQFRMEIEGVFTIVLNGDKGWISSMGEVKELAGEQLATQRRDHRAGYMSSLLPLRDMAFSLKMLPESKVGKTEARVIEAARKDWPTVKLYFDKKTDYLIKFEFKTRPEDLNFKEVTMEHLLSNFKEVDGARIPHKSVISRDGKVFVEAEIVSYRAEGKLDAKVFAKPE